MVFSVTPGAPDTLTVLDTLNGVPIAQPAVFVRQREISTLLEE